ncbi:SET domain-containing protein-lysine N-methyltransferase [Portibacter marinus]|uniref:SET domain-containing protein-lysine N-methyltransferase n=1 Tax=Portibacter marinus TaxID=2898660 RepID=UPI001F24DE6F|nr:SET domain-containing protein-lysine N-methyltransferase [Portibacter marinus]
MDEMRHITGLYLAYTDKGRSMFTAEKVSKGDIIEACPVILIPEDQKSNIHHTVLHDYYFIWPEGGIAIALGYGSIYNHSPTPNAKVVFDIEQSEIILVAAQDIEPTHEILIDYTDGQKNHPLWFDPK